MHPLAPATGQDAARYRALLHVTTAIMSSLTRSALFDAIAQALRTAMPFDRAALFVHDPARDVLRLDLLDSSIPSAYFAVGLEMPVRGSHVGWVLQQQRALVRRRLASEREWEMEDRALADGIQSYVMVPLVARGRPLGALAVASTTPDRYADADADFVLDVAGQVALAVENMQAYEEIADLSARMTRAADRYRTLLEVTNAIISNLTHESLFRAVAAALRRVIPFERTTVYLHDAARGVLRLAAIEATLPSSHFVVGFELPVSDTYLGDVLRNQAPLIRRDLATEQVSETEKRVLAEGFRALMVVPLVARGRAVGTLNVGSKTPGAYDGADAGFLREVANQVALAIENMTAYEEINALKARLEHENVYLHEELGRDHDVDEMVGRSPAFLALLDRVARVAGTDSTVLVTGETGTGKELIARALHRQSPRRARPLVVLNCSAISAGLVESELFGHVKGAFTGALERRVGRFELADGGTLFLDEVGELPLDTQVKLLRVLQERTFEPVGSNRSQRTDVRVIAATNRDLQDAVRAGSFRADLYYRLAVVPLAMPPLRERREDVPLLATYFLGRFARRFARRLEGIAPATLERLVAYPWPGNIRELGNVIERAVVLARGPLLELDDDLVPSIASSSPAPPPAVSVPPPSGDAADGGLDSVLEDVERRQILGALERAGGVIEGPRGAATLLRVHPNTLRSRMERLGLRRPRPEKS
jgi:formate hydrogenlyase transcriptional activator